MAVVLTSERLEGIIRENTTTVCRRCGGGLTLALGAAVLVGATSASASPTRTGATQASSPSALSLHVAGLPSRSTAFVLAERAWNHRGAPSKVSYYMVSEHAERPGEAITIASPIPARLAQTASVMHGTVNLAIVVRTSSKTYQWNVPARILAGHIQITRQLPPLSKWASGPTVATPNDILTCDHSTVRTWEQYTHLGELHIANVSGMTGKFENETEADTTLGIGYSASGDSGSFAGAGTVTLSNSIGSDGAITRDAGYHMYVQGHVYYEEDLVTGDICLNGYYIEGTSSVGDVTDGTNEAPTNPYGTCGADPHGLATVGPEGTWVANKSTAITYGGATTLLGFQISGSTGYTNSVNVSWHAGSTATYICGDKQPVQNSSVFYNSPS